MDENKYWGLIRDQLIEAVLEMRGHPHLVRKELALAAALRGGGPERGIHWLSKQELAFAAEQGPEAAARLRKHQGHRVETESGGPPHVSSPGVYALWRLECLLELAEKAAEHPEWYGRGPDPDSAGDLLETHWQRMRALWIKATVLEWLWGIPFFETGKE